MPTRHKVIVSIFSAVLVLAAGAYALTAWDQRPGDMPASFLGTGAGLDGASAGAPAGGLFDGADLVDEPASLAPVGALPAPLGNPN